MREQKLSRKLLAESTTLRQSVPLTDFPGWDSRICTRHDGEHIQVFWPAEGSHAAQTGHEDREFWHHKDHT